MLRLAITYDTAKNGGSAWHSLRSCQFKKLGEVLGTRRWLVSIQETRHNVCAVLYAGIAVIAFCKGYVCI